MNDQCPLNDEQFTSIWKNLATWAKDSAISPILINYARAVATAAVEAERQKEQTVPEGFGSKPERSQERADFEDWYVTHAFDYEASPLGSRDCALQWAAWMASGHYHARIPAIPEDRAALAEELAQELERDKWHVPAVTMQRAADMLRSLAASPPPPQPAQPVVVPRESIELLLSKCRDIDDEGPRDEGWQSAELVSAIVTVDEWLAAAQQGEKS